MPSAGELLRCERLKRNRTLPEIAKDTCICTRYLEAIEEDNPKILPGDFFHRSFIRQYAGSLSLDEALTRKILDTVGPPPDLDPLPVFHVAQQIADAEHRSKPLAQIPTRVAALLFLVVVTGCSGLYALWNRAQEAADPAMRMVVEQPAPSASAAPVSQPSPKADPTPSQAAVAVQPPTAEVAASTPTPALDEVADPGKIAVNLAATEKTWVSLSSAGRTVYAGTLDASQSKSFAIDENARLLTGNAAGLDVRINGRAVGPLGARGQVRLVLLSHDNFQVVTPRKM